MGKVCKIQIKDVKNNIVDLDEVDLIKNVGIYGNKQDIKMDRQVSIIFYNTYKESQAYREEGLCINRFMANILIGDIGNWDIRIGDKIKIGEGVLEIIEIGKECFPQCKLVNDNIQCPLRRGVFFCKVIKEGKITLGAQVIMGEI